MSEVYFSRNTREVAILNAIGFVLLLSLSANYAQAAPVALWGIKNCDGDAACPGSGDGSNIPANIFQINSDGSGFVNHGQVTLGGNAIDADGFAISENSPNSLMGFRIAHDDLVNSDNGTGSQLISIDTAAPTIATAIGTTLDGRDIRGAGFDSFGRLWALDSANNELLRIDTATGSVLENASLFLGTIAIDIATAADIAFRPDGSAIIASGDTFYEADLVSKTVFELFDDPGGFHSGLIYEPMSGDLIAFEVTGSDDVFRFDSFGNKTLITTPVFSFNAGRGDLAAVVNFQPIPVPATLWFFVPALSGLLLTRRRQN